MHIPPGLVYTPSATSQFWKDEFQDPYLDLLSSYNDLILLQVGSHIHRASLKQPNLAIAPLLLTPSISPIYFNNPSFTVLDVKAGDYTITTHSLQLWIYSLTSFKWWYKTKVKMPDFEFLKKSTFFYGMYFGKIMGYDFIIQVLSGVAFVA